MGIRKDKKTETREARAEQEEPSRANADGDSSLVVAKEKPIAEAWGPATKGGPRGG